MPSCAIITCRARSQVPNTTNERISFHKFPKEPDIKEKWIDVTGRENWFPTKTSTICSKHFKENDYSVKKSGFRYLRDGAIPSENIVRILSSTNAIPRPASSTSMGTPRKRTLNTTPCSSNVKRRKLQSQEISNPVTSNRGNHLTKSPRNKRKLVQSNMDPEKSTTENDEPMPKRKIQCDILPLTSVNDTPRKRKLQQIITTKESVIKRQQRQIKKIQAQNRRLKKKITKIEDLLNDLQQKFSMRSEDVNALKNANLKVEELLDRYICQTQSGGMTKQKYSPALRTFALTLHYYSPKAYEYVRNTFNTCLPHTRTLRAWYSSVDGEAGFTTESFAALKLKAESTKYPIIAGLVMDEMAIRRRIEWDGNRLHGYVEIGTNLDGDYITEAKEALVFLVTGINCSFKVPVGYFLVDGVTGTQRSDLVKQCLERIHETGIKIVSLTFDGCASNLSMINNLGCNLEHGNVTFKHPVTNNDIVAILDPSHMIKLIRNAFQMYRTFEDNEGNKIQWAYLEELNKVQEKEKFHLANKLRRQHIRFQNQKMKVKLATQLFSISVADAIAFCQKDLNMPQFNNSTATVNFITVINNMFDIFNSRSLNHYGFKKAISQVNAAEIFSYLDAAEKYISGLKCENGTLLKNSPRKVGFLGFLGCARALKQLYASLIESNELVYLPFYKMSQDHIELLFCNIRSHGGANNNPTARQFKAAYRKLLVHVELKDYSTGNCSALENISILNCSSAVKRINWTANITREDEIENDDDDDNYDDEGIYYLYENLSDYSTQVISHIAGNVVHVLMKKLHCDTCVSALLSNLPNSLHKFIVAKDKGGLLYPSHDVIMICKKTESVIRRHTDNLRKINKDLLTTQTLRSFVGTNIFDEISFHQFTEYPTSNHVSDLIKAVVEKYINIRLHFLLKNLTPETKRQLLTKYILFQGQ